MLLRQDYYSKRAAVLRTSGLSHCPNTVATLLGQAFPCFRCARGIGYYPIGLIGYLIGLTAANAAVALMQMGQPALLYLVPAIMGPVIALAWRRGELADWWTLSDADSASVTDAAGVGASGGGGVLDAAFGRRHSDADDDAEAIIQATGGGSIFSSRADRQRRSDSLLASEFSSNPPSASATAIAGNTSGPVVDGAAISVSVAADGGAAAAGVTFAVRQSSSSSDGQSLIQQPKR